MSLLVAAMLGGIAGVLAGMLGVGGGATFVPALVLVLGLSQIEAEATTLVAIVPMALLGSWRQHRYGNLDLEVGLKLGLFAAPGAVVGVVAANALPERALEVAFAGVLVLAGVRLLRRAVSPPA